MAQSKSLSNVFKLNSIVDVNEPRFGSGDFGSKLQAANDAMPSTGGIIYATGVQGAQTFSSSVTITKPVIILLGGITLTMGSNQLIFQASGSGAVGLPRTDENHGTTQFIYSGTGEAVRFKHGTVSTPLFGNEWKDIELVASGGAITSATFVGLAFYGTRYSNIVNPAVYNGKQGIGMLFTGNGSGLGFGSTNHIHNPAMSTNKKGIVVSAVGGSASTHGFIYGGFIAGGSNAGVAITGIEIGNESWQIFGTDTGASDNVGSVGLSFVSGADDCAVYSPRFESGYDGIVFGAGTNRNHVFAPRFITMVNTKVTNGGTNNCVWGATEGPFASGLYSTGAGIRVSVASVLTHQMTNGTLDVFGPTAVIRLGDAQDVILARKAANTLAMENSNSDQLFRTYGMNGGYWERGSSSELITLSTAGTTTDSSANLLPADAIIEAVVARVTTTITTATDWKLGDATVAGRFSGANAVMTAGTTQVGTVQADQTGTSGPRQTAAAKLRITTTGTPGAGVIRVIVFWRRFIPPTS